MGVETVEGIGPRRAKALANLGVATVRDLLYFLPRDYHDRRGTAKIGDVKEGDTITLEGEVTGSRFVKLRGRMSLAEVTFKDETGSIKATWFGRGYLAKTFTPGMRVFLYGTVGKYKGLALKNPEYEVLEDDDEDLLHTGRITPIYRLTDGVTQRNLRRWIAGALAALDGGMDEPLPERLRERYSFPDVADALRAVHFPEELKDAQAARNRFVYEELLGVQFGVLSLRAARHREAAGIRHRVDGPRLEALRSSLPFTLTGAQTHAAADILGDMASPRPMARLLQGDVGCGKTVVSLHAIAAAADSGYQTALMAPTEILAEQHAAVLVRQLAPLGIEVALLTGSTRGAKDVRKELASGAVPVVVGTHALIQEKVAFHRLGLAIIDEQHRFGVFQRGRLVDKGPNVDILHMTATPIPRTLAITVYGGMDVSVIDELPPGRLPVKTRRIPEDKAQDLYAYIVDQAEQGRQTYIICPLVSESDKRELKAVTSHFEELAAGPLAGVNAALVHGRMGQDEKDCVMRRFKTGEVDVLFSTTVIEVGIDVPSATTMVIEDASQFGLTQLHQLRGRVGRGTEQSYCFLMGKPKTAEGEQRLEIMCRTSDGFEIAEEDLKLRGPGEFHGVRQAGLSDLRVADLVRDVRLLDRARRDAEEVLAEDPHLEDAQYAHLRKVAARFEELNA